MDEIFKLYETTGALHHAYLVEGDARGLRAQVFEQLRSCGLPHEGHPDFWTGEFEVFGIDESRELARMQAEGAVLGERRVFVIFVTLITTEAQHALLKTFEEPCPGVHFFLVVPSAYALLPTLRSRLMHIQQEGDASMTEHEKDADDFLGASLSERMVFAKKIAEKKDRAHAIILVDIITQKLYKAFVQGGERQGDFARALLSATRARQYLNDRAPSVKMLFEYLALTTPVIP